jgi:DNA end-binding protein Ku
LTPSGSIANEGFGLIREGMRRKKAALGSTVLFRRIRTLLLYPQGPLLIAYMLHFTYEVWPASEVFEHIPEPKMEGEMLELAKHIIKTYRQRRRVALMRPVRRPPRPAGSRGAASAGGRQG